MYKRSKTLRHKRNTLLWLRLPISHCEPFNPGAQLQLNPFTRSVQVPLFVQGWLAQSSISVLEDTIDRIKMQKLNLLYLTAPEATMKHQLNLYTGNAFSFYRDNIIPGSLLVVRINNINIAPQSTRKLSELFACYTEKTRHLYKMPIVIIIQSGIVTILLLEISARDFTVTVDRTHSNNICKINNCSNKNVCFCPFQAV